MVCYFCIENGDLEILDTEILFEKKKVRWVNNVFVEFKTRLLYVRNT